MCKITTFVLKGLKRMAVELVDEKVNKTETSVRKSGSSNSQRLMGAPPDNISSLGVHADPQAKLESTSLSRART